MKANEPSRKGQIVELSLLTAAVLAIAHTLYRLRVVPWINEYLSVLIALLLLYAPILILWIRRRGIDFIDRDLKGFFKSIGIGLIASAIILPPFFVAAHFWQLWVEGYEHVRWASVSPIYAIALFQLFLVALPEEFYFRGYVQSTMCAVFPRWWGVVMTAAIFAVAHSIIFYQWWHFAIFFPALVFGYLRERTGSIVAPIIFHTMSNVVMTWFARCY